MGNVSFDEISMPAHNHLYEDMPKSVRPWIEELLNANYRVMIYNGQLDVIVPNAATEEYIDHIKWYRSDEYAKSKRGIWRVNKEVAGIASFFVFEG